MDYSIAEIAGAIGARAVGDVHLRIMRLAEPADAGPDDLAMAGTPKYAEDLGQGTARAAMLWADADWQALGLSAAILPDRPRFAMAGLTAMMDPGPGVPPGLHDTALIDPAAHLAEGVSIGPYSVIGAGAEIGANTIVGPFCHIGRDAVIGPDSLLRDHVSIGPRVRIGARFIAQPGVRIGGDGFSFVTAEKSGAESARETLGADATADAQPWHRIHSLGAVEIGDDVEIGSNSSVDAGTIRPTRIGDGTKMDSLVQVGHNAVIGRNALLCGMVGVAGSTRIGDHVVLGGQTGVSDNLTVGDRVITGGGTMVLSNVPAGRVLLGYPAIKMDAQIEAYKALRRLPRALRDLAALKKAVFKGGSSD